MERYAESGLEPHRPELNQAGLEVRNETDTSAHSGWPGSTKSVWGTNNTEHQPTPPYSERRSILGLSLGTFWGIVVLLALIIGGGVGGGVGAGLASQKKGCITSGNNNGTFASTTTVTISASITQSQSIAQSPTTASDSTVSPAPSSQCANQANTFNGTSLIPLDASGSPIPYTSSKQQTFRVYCNTNWPGGASYGNPGVHDILKIYQPDLMHCVAACAEYNAGYSNNLAAGVSVGGGYCTAVSLVMAVGEFCYLKNGTGVNDTSTSGPVRIDSAMLL